MQQYWKYALVMLWITHISNVAAQFQLASEELMQNDTIYKPLLRGKMVLTTIGINFIKVVYGCQRLDDVNHIIRLGGGRRVRILREGLDGVCVCVCNRPTHT